jgi:uncharacterized membrane-anchored protein
MILNDVFMKFSAFRRAAVHLVAAFVIGGAWVVHMASGAHAHEAADSDCQVCAVSCSPALNADCGTVLLAAPVDFELLKTVVFIAPAEAEFSPVFLSRAPPSA